MYKTFFIRKVNVNMSLCFLTEHQDMKTWEADVELHAFLTSALDGEWSVSRSGRFTPKERAS
jgi:hypothetical protein